MGTNLKYKEYKKALQTKDTEVKEKEKEEKERVQDLKEKLGDKYKEKPEPIPVAFKTFEYWSNYYKKHPPNPRQKDPNRKDIRGGPGLGTAPRFGTDEKEKYVKAVKLYNAVMESKTPLDPKNDPVPGPGYYNLQEVYPGKTGRFARSYSAQAKPGERILKNISKGITTSIYHRK
jgi:hypothetical protein